MHLLAQQPPCSMPVSLRVSGVHVVKQTHLAPLARTSCQSSDRSWWKVSCPAGGSYSAAILILEAVSCVAPGIQPHLVNRTGAPPQICCSWRSTCVLGTPLIVSTMYRENLCAVLTVLCAASNVQRRLMINQVLQPGEKMFTIGAFPLMGVPNVCLSKSLPRCTAIHLTSDRCLLS